MKPPSEIDVMRASWRQLYPGQSEEALDRFLGELDRRRTGKPSSGGDPDWYRDAVVYSLYADLFGRDFPGLVSRLDYLRDLGVTCLWLLPILDSPMRDVGFDIRRYDRVRRDLLGLSADASDEEQQQVFRDFLAQAHQRGIRVIFDIAMNHTSDEHAWFQQAKSSPKSPYRDYYIWSPTDQKYKDTRLLFKGLCPSNWEKCGKEFYFHRFYEFQPDLNYRNPVVLLEMARNLVYWQGEGVDGFRADAIPFVWKEDGTNCENLPGAHAIVRFFRAVLNHVQPGMLLLAEACQPPKDVVAYFGRGDECHAGYHFPLMPRIFISLALEQREPILEILDPAFTPPIPAGCQWFLFLRCHDELTLEMVTPDERKLMNGYYLRDPRWNFREGEGISARLANLFEKDPRRIGLACSIMLTLPGTPVIYYGDEFGRSNDEAYFEEMKQQSGYADSRFFVRGRIDWIRVETDLRDADSFASQVLSRVRRQVLTRNKHRCFGRGTLEWLDVRDEQGQVVSEVLAYRRAHAGDEVCVIQNLSRRTLEVLPPLPSVGRQKEDLLGQRLGFDAQTDCLRLPPYAHYWI